MVAASRILMGVIGRPHGVRGLVHVHSYADGDLAGYAPLLDEAGRAWSIQWRGDGIAELRDESGASLTDRNAAERLVNVKLYIERDRLPPAEEDDFYWSDLIGLRAMGADGVAFGRVVQVHDYGGGPSLELESGQFIPFTKTCVPSVDLPGGTLLIVPPVETEAPMPSTGEPSPSEPSPGEPHDGEPYDGERAAS